MQPGRHTASQLDSGLGPVSPASLCRWHSRPGIEVLRIPSGCEWAGSCPDKLVLRRYARMCVRRRGISGPG
jgi:hypothetical protein